MTIHTDGRTPASAHVSYRRSFPTQALAMGAFAGGATGGMVTHRWIGAGAGLLAGVGVGFAASVLGNRLGDDARTHATQGAMALMAGAFAVASVTAFTTGAATTAGTATTRYKAATAGVALAMTAAAGLSNGRVST